MNEKTRLFLDESGDCKCGNTGGSKHFCLTIISIPTEDSKAVKARFKAKAKQFIRNGWDKGKEIKAHNVYIAPGFGAPAVLEMIDQLADIAPLQISYLVVNKDRITSQSLREAKYGIRYNYFTGVLLSEMVFEDSLSSIFLTYDLRNKETHEKRRFKEYLATKLLEGSIEREVEIEFDAEGLESHQSYGLMAVDFFSWALYRKFEYGDRRFASLFSGKILRRREWYIGK